MGNTKQIKGEHRLKGTYIKYLIMFIKAKKKLDVYHLKKNVFICLPINLIEYTNLKKKLNSLYMFCTGPMRLYAHFALVIRSSKIKYILTF